MNLKNFLFGRLKSFIPAFQGIWFIFRHEKNTWVHLLGTIVAIFLIFLLRFNYIEILFISSAIIAVWMAEIFNTAIEYTLDFVHSEKNQKIKIIKDISAAGVLLAAVYAVFVAFLILLERCKRIVTN